MIDVTAIQSELQCKSCAGQCLYDPAVQALNCSSCGTVRRLEREDDSEAWAEFPFDPDAPLDEAPITFEGQVLSCQTCGGTVTFVAQSLSSACAYCDGPVVLKKADRGFAPMALIPYRVPQQDAQAFALAWVRKRLAAPNDLYGVVAKARVAGIYVPFWTFDSQEAVDYWAKYTVRRNKRNYTKRVRGNIRIRFDDLLVPASPHVTPLIRDGILHDFDPQRLRPYRAGYVAGFAAEQHHQSVAEGLAANADDKALLIRNKIKRDINKSRVHDIGYHTDTTGIHYRRILLPVWILHYTYDGAAHKVVVCGMQGRTFGERPFSMKKLLGYSALLSSIAVVTGLVWGAVGLL
ncbi:hypothetical protein ACERZ8_14320 [Tateyamaria armeniaca]|uniref:Primosomal protein N' (Replication factor Y)-superfamily II helicase n=1 Tax=Tateyamaria armeniaca TaxID=2518930 RepID=A0ABW8UV25_9RHOB